MDTGPLRVGFAPGVTPDKWARVWRERMPRSPLDLVPLADRDGVALLRTGELHLCLVRLPVDRDGLHLIPLYDEQPVVVVSREHPASAYDEVDVRDLADEHVLHRPGDRPSALRQAVEGAAADAGVVLVPMSLARLHQRRDVVSVRVRDAPMTSVGLAWRRDLDDPRVQDFIGVVRGRTANSSRGR